MLSLFGDFEPFSTWQLLSGHLAAIVESLAVSLLHLKFLGGVQPISLGELLLLLLTLPMVLLLALVALACCPASSLGVQEGWPVWLVV